MSIKTWQDRCEEHPDQDEMSNVCISDTPSLSQPMSQFVVDNGCLCLIVELEPFFVYATYPIGDL